MTDANPPDRPPAAAVPPPRVSPKRHTRAWIVAAAAIVLVMIAVSLWRQRAGGAAAARRAGAHRAVPVVADTARVRDFDVHLTALGTVTPLRTVTVRSRVDGQLVAVHFTEGQVVAAGTRLADLDPQPFQAQLQQTQAQLARDTALLDNSKIDLDRYQKLLELDSISKQQVDTQASLVRQYEAQVNLDQAAVRNATLQLAWTHITSEFSGRVGLRLVDPGNIVHASDPGGLTVITQLQPISVLFSIPQHALPEVLRRYQTRQPLPVALYDTDGQTSLATGRVATIDNEIDPTTGTVKVRAEFDNADRRLFPNQFVNVRMLVQRLPQATVVASAAIQRGVAGTFAYVVGSLDTVHVRPLTVGPTEGETAVVADGLSPGETVVVDGVDQLREGAVVQLLHPARNGAGAGGGAGARHGAGRRHGAGVAEPGAAATGDVPAGGPHHRGARTADARAGDAPTGGMATGDPSASGTRARGARSGAGHADGTRGAGGGRKHHAAAAPDSGQSGSGH